MSNLPRNNVKSIQARKRAQPSRCIWRPEYLAQSYSILSNKTNSTIKKVELKLSRKTSITFCQLKYSKNSFAKILDSNWRNSHKIKRHNEPQVKYLAMVHMVASSQRSINKKCLGTYIKNNVNYHWPFLKMFESLWWKFMFQWSAYTFCKCHMLFENENWALKQRHLILQNIYI